MLEQDLSGLTRKELSEWIACIARELNQRALDARIQHDTDESLLCLVRDTLDVLSASLE